MNDEENNNVVAEIIAKKGKGEDEKMSEEGEKENL
jgi:hypothetical protein